MTDFASLYETARARKARLVLPEIDDPTITAAAERLRDEGLAEVVPLAPVSPSHVAAIQAVRTKLKTPVAERMLARPLFRAGAMVATGQADAMVAGLTVPTKSVIEAASMTIGSDGSGPVASFFLMLFDHRTPLIFADCAVNTDPDAAALAGIGQAIAQAAERLTGSGRVAFLSYSTGTSGTGAQVGKVREAVELAEAAGVDAIGPVQADAALNGAIATKKGIEGEIATALVFPNLDAANIGYKLTQELAGAQAVGPVLTGLNRPVCDLSRGASVDDIVKSAVVTLALADH